MNANDAILAHSRWKTLLTTYLQKPDNSINVGDLQVDNKCDLGRWIHTEGSKFAALPEYAALKASHAKFHQAAAGVVKKANAGLPVKAETELGLGSEFGLASMAVVNGIKAFFAKIG